MSDSNKFSKVKIQSDDEKKIGLLSKMGRFKLISLPNEFHTHCICTLVSLYRDLKFRNLTMKNVAYFL